MSGEDTTGPLVLAELAKIRETSADTRDRVIAIETGMVALRGLEERVRANESAQSSLILPHWCSVADNLAVLAEVRGLAEDVQQLDQQVRRLEQVLLPITGRTDAAGRALRVGQEVCCEVDGQVRRGVVVPRGRRLVVALDPRLDAAADERRRVEALRLGYEPE